MNLAIAMCQTEFSCSQMAQTQRERSSDIQWSLRIKDTLGVEISFLYLKAVLWWEVRITIVSTRVIPIGAVASVLYIEVVLWYEGPL